MSSHQPRAERISEEKWNEWRVDLERLYLEKEASKKDIIDHLRIKHGKEITAKQLKHRFRKWGITKYMSVRDMKVVIALVKEHEAQGNEITVCYKGYEVDRSRIERAMRRCRGPIPSPTSIPSYIEYQCRPHHMSKAIQREIPISSVRTPVESSMAGPSTPFTCMDEGTQPLISGGTRPYVSQVPRSMNSQGNPGLVRSPEIFKISDITSADARVLSTTSPVDANTQSMTSADALSHQSFSSQGKFIGSQTLEKTCKRNSGSDWLTAGTLSLGHPSLYETTGEFSWSPENTRLRHGWSGHTFHSPFRLSTGLCTTQDGGTNFNIQLASARNDCKVILPNGEDPEEIVTSLRLTRAHLLMSSDGTMLNRNFSRGSTLDLLRHLLCSGWLLNELENLLCWSYEASARAIRQRQSAKNGALKDTYSKRSDIHNDNYETLGTETKLHRRNPALSWPQVKLTSTWSSHMPNGTLNLQLRTVTPQHLILDDKESPIVLEMYSIPITAHRTTGISAIFVNPLAEKQCPGISPQIRTFNVVPEGSEIIQCVRNNDLHGVRNLFDLGKASPSDVDPRGFSLLSYAMYNGCSDIFDTLVRTGAGIQNCERFGSQHDAIGAIWSYFVIYNSNDHEKEHAPGCLDSLDECKRMTEVVLANGCDIEDTVGFSAQANTLFELCYHWPIDQAHTSTSERALEYLINIGYEAEKKNDRGQTPLLWTASSYQPQVIKCLRVFLRRGADLNAVDSAGRGVVHSALAAPHIFDSWRTLTITTRGVHVTKYYGLPHLIYRTESTTHADDYSDQVLESNPFAEQDDASLFGTEAYLFQTDNYATTQETHDSTDDISTTFNSAPTSSTSVEDSTLEEYVQSLDPHGVGHLIKNPIHILKTRLRHKLLTLLQADCDPNLLDNAGASPSDYARRDGLWPQWSWALEQSGHIYDARNDRWVRIGRF